MEISLFVPFSGDEPDVSALFNAFGQALKNVKKPVQFHALRVGNRAVNLGAQIYQRSDHSLARHAQRLVLSANEQVAHGNVQPLYGSSRFLCAGQL